MGDNLSYPAWKRAMDVTGSLIGVILFLPFFPMIAAAIKMDTPGPVFVKLGRISAGKAIKVYKFRSMVKDAESMKEAVIPLNERSGGCFFKMAHDPRVTRVGRVLRKLRIDEIPQFLNVLKGDMALVGPRPHEPGEVSKYPKEYAHVPFALAGVTGISQVSGASSLYWLHELALDDFYVRNKNFAMDMWVIAKTIGIFISDRTGV